MKPYLALIVFLSFQSCRTPDEDGPSIESGPESPAVKEADNSIDSTDDAKFALVESFNHSPTEWKALNDAALAGDPKAALRIAEHYALGQDNEVEAKKWYRLAVKNGGAREAAIYRSFLDTR